jgi:Predicted solute binding protein
MGGISTGKPIVNKSDTVVVNMTPTSVAESYKITSTPSAGVAVAEPKHSSIINITKSDSPQSPLFLFGSARSSGEHDAASKSSVTKGFSSLCTKSGSPNKEAVPGRSVATSSGIFAPTVESSTAKPNVLDSTLSISGSHTSDVKNKSNNAGASSFTVELHSEKLAEPGNFSFGLGLNNVSSFGKLNDASKKLEDHYENLSPPGTPECSHGEAVSSTGSSVSSSLFTFNFTVPTTTKAGIIPSSSNRRIQSPLLTTPIMHLNSIVAGIGDGDSAAKPTTKPVVSNKSIEMLSASNATSGTAFSFGPFSLGHPQQGGSSLGKADEPRKSSDTFTFSLGGSLSSSVPTPSPLVSSSGDMSQMTPPKSSAAMTTGVNLKTPLLTALGSQNLESTSSPQVIIFGAAESQKPSPSIVSSGNTSVSSSSTNIFAQAATSVFGNLTTGSPAKQPVSPGNIFGAIPNSSGTTGKESTDSTTSAAKPELQKSESTPKSQSLAISSLENENIFSQSSLLLGGLSIGSGASSKAVSPGSIFGGASDSLAANFAFGKQSASTESQNSIGVQNVPEPTVAAESLETQVQKSESPSNNTQDSASKPNTTPSFDKTPASPDENSKSSEGTENQLVPDTSPLFGGAKTESSTTFTFGHLPSSPSAPQTSVVFGQAKPVTGSIFGAVVTSPATSQQTVAPLTSGATTTSPATQTPSSANTTFSFSLPTSASSSTPFGQKTTSMFGQPVSSDAPATTSSGSFFGQPICSPSGFGQSGGSVFGQPAATTAAKTNIFGQNTSTTTAPTVFGQGSASAKPNIFGQTSTSFFGQASPTGSSFLSGGFGSKPTFGQSGGSIFGQTNRSVISVLSTYVLYCKNDVELEDIVMYIHILFIYWLQ